MKDHIIRCHGAVSAVLAPYANSHNFAALKVELNFGPTKKIEGLKKGRHVEFAAQSH